MKSKLHVQEAWMFALGSALACKEAVCEQQKDKEEYRVIEKNGESNGRNNTRVRSKTR